MNTNSGHRIQRAAVIALTGFIGSGPLALILVRQLHPQPDWRDAATFVANYHMIQDVPFYFGFVLVAGMVLLVCEHHLQYQSTEQRTQTFLAVVAVAVFSSQVIFNYVSQTTFVRHLALEYNPWNDAIIAAFSMANPHSFCWANELWAYGMLGAATWLISGIYRHSDYPLFMLLVLNGIISIGTAVFCVIDITWVLRPVGIISYVGWNVLMVAILIRIWLHAKKNSYERNDLLSNHRIASV